MGRRTRQVKRYNLTMSDEMYEKLEELARKRNTTVAELLRSSIKWELLVEELRDNDGSVLIKRSREEEPVEVLVPA